MKLTLNDISEIITISFYGRSGSLFLQSLLDSHPNILMLPGDYIRFYFNWWEYLERKFGNCLDVDFIIKEFGNTFSFVFDARKSTNAFEGWDGDFGVRLGFDTMGENQDEFLKIDKSIFNRELKNLLEDIFPIKSDDFFKAIHIAYFYGMGRVYDNEQAPNIVYHTHVSDIDGPKELFKVFNEIKTICMIREPIQSLGSLINTYRRAGNISLDQMLYILNPFLHNGVTKRKKESSCAIKLEDLHTNSKNTLKNICRFLNISWDDKLLESTFDGLEWWNAKGSQKVNGFNPNIVKRKHEDLFTEFDRERLKALLFKKYDAWEYGTYRKDYETLYKELEEPFEFEKFIFYQNEEERKNGREIIKNLFRQYWKEVNTNENMPLEVKLLK
ncbi:hypothetical protein RBU49_03405 [Clostridium sp. MB40-C1]|uniref:hypothetical protein n=1 Tax=Clostridium sp. MB40-C1 TaxID=3070996 RepID=UPI0027E097CD|nr:hypothetical protein [Clostridium sp. MB40-C1]WMJ81317.1 hypothetical protein RBU49_03405 [Clostridium sp. MB40-C1]